MAEIDAAVARILRKHAEVPPARAMLVAVSGIDGSGKGYITKQIVERLQVHGKNLANLNIDGWLELPERRFSKDRPAEHFFEHGIRFQEMFETLVLPLRDRRSVRLEADLADATNDSQYHRFLYQLADIDIVVLEGIFLLRRAFRPLYDLTIWVDCTFETALERALQRNQEHMDPAVIARDYAVIYHAAQRLHFAQDDPRTAADLVIENDPD